MGERGVAAATKKQSTGSYAGCTLGTIPAAAADAVAAAALLHFCPAHWALGSLPLWGRQAWLRRRRHPLSVSRYSHAEQALRAQ